MSHRLSRSMHNPDLRREKLEQAILFFVTHLEIQQLGKTELMKLLYYADFDHFEQYDDSVTGARYRRLEHGPVPDDAWAVLDEMVERKRLVPARVPSGPYDLITFQAQESFDPTAFSASERATLQEVAERFKAFSTKQIENATHGEAPWIAVKPNEIIPYYLAYYRNNYGGMEMDEDKETGEPAERPTEDAVFAREVVSA